MWKQLLAVHLIAIVAFLYLNARSIETGPGIVAPDLPRQELLLERTHELDGYQLQRVARFQLEARVLGVEWYYLGREADLSPVDLALGWGRMSDQQVLAGLNIWQSNRFVYWSARQWPIPEDEVIESIANIHIIPANATVESVLDRVRKGHVVRLSGHLVNISAPDGWRWLTSLSRSDVGPGACELMVVDELEIVEPGPTLARPD